MSVTLIVHVGVGTGGAVGLTFGVATVEAL